MPTSHTHCARVACAHTRCQRPCAPFPLHLQGTERRLHHRGDLLPVGRLVRLAVGTKQRSNQEAESARGGLDARVRVCGLRDGFLCGGGRRLAWCVVPTHRQVLFSIFALILASTHVCAGLGSILVRWCTLTELQEARRHPGWQLSLCLVRRGHQPSRAMPGGCPCKCIGWRCPVSER